MRITCGAVPKMMARTMVRPLAADCAEAGTGEHLAQRRFRAELRQDHDVENHLREGEKDVADEGEHLVPPAAAIAGGHAHQHADDIGDDGGERRPEQHQPRAEDQAREDVAALVVGAEPVSSRRPVPATASA